MLKAATIQGPAFHVGQILHIEIDFPFPFPHIEIDFQVKVRTTANKHKKEEMKIKMIRLRFLNTYTNKVSQGDISTLWLSMGRQFS